MTTQSTLSNGTRVLLAPFAGTEAAAFLVLFKVGSRNEDISVWGASHFIEHLMFKGTHRRPHTVDISQELDRYGAQYNAYTGKDLTGYWVKIAAKQLPVAIDLLNDMLFSSKFDAEEMEREKRVIIEEIKMYEENPIMHIEDLLEDAMFEGHVLGRNIAGTPESMRAMTRDNVLAYRHRFYRPDNMVIVAAGNLPPNTLALIEDTFGKHIQPQDVFSPQSPRITHETDVGRIRRQQKDVEQVQVALGFPTVGRDHVDEAPLKLLASILGGTMSSRLFVEVRERRGLCYTVRAGTDAYEETGMLTVRSGLDATRLPEALRVITDELRKVVHEGVTANELMMVKDNIRGGMALTEDSSDRAEFYARQILFLGKMDEPESRLARYDKVTCEDIARVAKAYLRFDRMTLAAIGPFADDDVLRAMIPCV